MAGQSHPAWGPALGSSGDGALLWALTGSQENRPPPLCGAGPSAGLEKAGVWSSWLLAIGSLSGFLLRASSVWNSNGKKPALAGGPVALRFPVWWFADVWDPG